jgi:hypothetical protein
MLLQDPSWSYNAQIVVGDLLKTTHQMIITYLNIILRLLPTIIEFFSSEPLSLHAFKKMSLCGFWFGSSAIKQKKLGFKHCWQEEHLRKVHWILVWILALNKLFAATDQTWGKNIICYYCVQYGNQNLLPPTRIMSTWFASHALSFVV